MAAKKKKKKKTQSKSVAKKAPAKAKPVAKKAPAKSKPVAKKAPAKSKPVAKKAPAKSKASPKPARTYSVPMEKPFSKMSALEKRLFEARLLFGDEYNPVKGTVETLTGSRYEYRRHGVFFGALEMGANAIVVRILPAQEDVAELRAFQDRHVTWTEDAKGWFETRLGEKRSDWLAAGIGGLTGAKTRELDLKQ